MTRRTTTATRRGRARGEEPDIEDVIAAAGADPREEDAKLCATLFKGLVFFIQPRYPAT